VIEQVKSAENFSFVKGSGSLPTVELDMQSLEEAGIDFLVDEVCKALQHVVGQERPITVYVLESPSINFGEPGYSVFIGVGGAENVLKLIYAYFAKIDDVKVRYGDYIQTSRSVRAIHVEFDEIWVPNDEETWMAVSFGGEPADSNEDEETLSDEPGEFDLDDDSFLDELEKIENVSKPLRVRAARKDASVGSIRRTIERIFGLPEGAVQLCGPDRVALRSDARIGTLRKRWSK
jgi:hypothetical protein